MKLDNIFTNSISRGDDLLETLNSFDNLVSVSIASPFLSSNPFLTKILNVPCNIRLILRLCEQTPLQELKKLAECGSAEIRYFMGGEFHSKIYIINEAYLIFGSSNFTYGGLYKNKEINIGIDSSDHRFEQICAIYNEYWKEATPLGLDEIDAFTTIVSGIPKAKTTEPLFEKKLNDELHKIKRRRLWSPEAREAQIKGEQASSSKAVVCLTNDNEYPSLITASEAEYSYKRGYQYISAVCKGEKEHYKGDLWLFKDEYDKMTQSEIEERKRAFSQRNEHDVITEKYLVNDQVFNKQTEVQKYFLETYGANLTRQAFSDKIGRSKDLGISFCRFNFASEDIYIFFAEYYQIHVNSKPTEEIAIEKSLEELQDYYESLFNLELGDCMAVDILLSSKKIYKMDGQYYKNKSNIKGFDRKINKREILQLMENNKNYVVLGNISYDSVSLSTQKIYYIKDHYIFKNATEYISRELKTLSKDDVMLEFEMFF